MGQKTNPIGNRLGIIKGWDSNWFGGRDMANKVVEDEKIRRYLKARIEKGGVARLVIERTLSRVTVTIHTSRPGIIIGRGGQEVDLIREELRKITSQKDIQINIVEIRKPEIDATITGETIAKQIESRINYRRAIKASIQAAMRGGAEGIKVRISGRLNGADIARSEEYKQGRTPLHTFRADIDYALVEAQTVYGKIGIKIWICRGMVFGKRDLSPNIGVKKERTGAEAGGGDRREGGNRPPRRDGDRREGDRGGNNNRDNNRDGNRGGNNRGGGGGGNRGGGGGNNKR